jgi:hypothetical protein
LRDEGFVRCSFSGPQIGNLDLRDLSVEDVDFSDCNVQDNQQFMRLIQPQTAT